MKHLNGNILCVVDTETTGTDPTKHDILEVCIMPLNKFLEPSNAIPPFNLTMKPKRPENIDFEALRATHTGDQDYFDGIVKNKDRIIDTCLRGIDPDFGADLAVEWFEQLQLAPRKRLIPVAHNWSFDRGFLIEWLGNLTFELVFDPRVRDTMTIGAFMNDFCDYRGDPYPFQKLNLQYMCNNLQVQRERAHTALDDCLATAEIYKRMVRQHYQTVPVPNGTTEQDSSGS